MAPIETYIRRRFFSDRIIRSDAFPDRIPQNSGRGPRSDEWRNKIEVGSSDQTSRLCRLKKPYRMSQNTDDFIWTIISFTSVVIISARDLDHLKLSNNNIIMEEQIDVEITDINRDQAGLFAIFNYLQDTFDHKFSSGTAGNCDGVDGVINPAAEFYNLIHKVRIADASDHLNNDTEAPVFAGVDIGRGSGVIASSVVSRM